MPSFVCRRAMFDAATGWPVTSGDDENSSSAPSSRRDEVCSVAGPTRHRANGWRSEEGGPSKKTSETTSRRLTPTLSQAKRY